MRRSPLEHLEAEVAARYGSAAAVSVDRERAGIIARAWTREGHVALASNPHRTAYAAIQDLRAKVAGESGASHATVS